MTTLVAWLGVDARGHSSVYLASDSRISWAKQSVWDAGRKLYFSQGTPDIFGYCGTVLFPSQVLSQIGDLASRGLLFRGSNTAQERHDSVATAIQDAFTQYPTRQAEPFTILHCTREGQLMESRFSVAAIGWEPTMGWATKTYEMPQNSGVIAALGTGHRAVERWHAIWQRTSEKGTSRAVFSAFCDALHNGDDPNSGGAPQLAGLIRKGNGFQLGVVYRNERYFVGLPLGRARNAGTVDWRNEVFERCDGVTGLVLGTAQRHYRPKGLGVSGNASAKKR